MSEEQVLNSTEVPSKNSETFLTVNKEGKFSVNTETEVPKTKHAKFPYIRDETNINSFIVETEELESAVDKVLRERKRKSVSRISRESEKEKSSSTTCKSHEVLKIENTNFDNTEYQDWVSFDKSGDLFVMGNQKENSKGSEGCKNKDKGPIKISNNVKFKQISIGEISIMALSVDGTVFTYRYNDKHGLSRRRVSSSDYISKEIQFPKGEVIVKLCMGDFFSAALSESGKVYAWGVVRGPKGPIRFVNSTINKRSTSIYSNRDKCSNIATGKDHLIILTKSGKVLTCGRANEGQLGRLRERIINSQAINGSATYPLFLKEVHFTSVGAQSKSANDFSKRVKNIFASKNSSFARMFDGSLYGWGLNDHKQLDPNQGDIIFYPILMTNIMENCLNNELDAEALITGGINYSFVLNKKTKVLYKLGKLEKKSKNPETFIKQIGVNSSILFSDCICGDKSDFGISDDQKLYFWNVNDCKHKSSSENEDSFKPTLVTSTKNLKLIQALAGSEHIVLLCLSYTLRLR